MEDRRLSRRDFALLVSSAAAGFLLGGFFGYLTASKEITERTMTITQTKTLTETAYKIQTVTKTITSTITKTITEKPTINIEVKVGKGYVESSSDVEILTRLYTDQKLDEVSGRYRNAGVEGELNFKEFSEGYEARFLTQKEPGTQYVEFKVEKDGAKAGKQLSIDVGLSDEEIENSVLKREGIRTLWRDLLESKVSNDLEKLEEYLKKEKELLKGLNVEKINRASGVYLRNLITYLDENQLDYSNILNGLGLVLASIPSRPWIVYGNYVEGFENAEFLVDGESAYLLAKLLSEVEVGERHVYAARAMVDQMQTIAKWLKIDVFDVFEYENRKLQLYDLTKKLFEKHLEFEGKGKRASVADDALIERWSDRSEVNKNKHIYLGLRQCLLGAHLFITDPVERTYAWEHDKEFLLRKIQPNGWDPDLVPYPEKGLKTLSEWIENYGKINEEVNYVIKHPEKKYIIRSTGTEGSPIEGLKFPFEEPRSWHNTFFPTVTQTYKQDIYETLFKNGSNESRIPIILKIWGVMTFDSPKFLEEVSVELATCYGSVMGYPMYREGFTYPPGTFKGALHGEPSFILNKEDEELLYSRSKEELLIEPNSYSLNVFFTRRWAVEKDKSRAYLIYLPTLEIIFLFDKKQQSN